MSTTKLLIGGIVIVLVAIAGYMYMSPTSIEVDENGTTLTTDDKGVMPTGSLDDFSSSIEADLSAEATAAMNSSDVDASLASQAETITNINNSTNDSNF